MDVVLLGRVAVVAGGCHHEVRRAQARGLLALLALNAGRHLSLSALVEEMWAGTAPPSARAQVHSAISAIRRLMVKIGSPDVVVADRFGYLLALDAKDVDVGRFEHMIAQAHQELNAGAITQAIGHLECGLALWQGQPLANASGAFVDAARSRLDDQRLHAWELLSDVQIALGRHAEVAVSLAPLVQSNPLRESLLVRLMVALSLTGRQAEALHNFRTYREILAEQHGLDPSAEITRLEVAILRGERPAYATSVRTASPPIPRSPIARIAVDPVPAQLPADISPFVGRTHQLRLLDSLASGVGPYRGAGAPIVSIVGPAGVGKTALALRWAHAARERYPGGQLYVDLRGFSPGVTADPAHVLAGFVRALGGPEHTPTDVNEAAAFYRTALAGKRVLIVLDNAASPQQVRPLLPVGAGSLTLVTSREALGGLIARDGAIRIRLSVLHGEESMELLASMLGDELVRADPVRYAELAELCGYLPLALRIAAAHLADQSGEEASSYLRRVRTNRLAALSMPGDEDAGVRKAFDWAYVNLPDPAQRVFRLIGLVPGADLTAPTCGHLADLSTEEAEALLEQLADAHLLERRAPDRYGCHDLLKDYAGQLAITKQTPKGRMAAKERLMRWYVDRTEQAVRALSAGREGVADSWLEVERSNLVAAVQWSQVDGLRELGRRLAESMSPYLVAGRYLADGRKLGEAVLTGAATVDEPKALATGRLSLATAAVFAGEYSTGIEHARSALAYSERAGWVGGQIQALWAQGLACVDLGDASRAAEHFHQIMELVRAHGMRDRAALPLGGLGSMYYYLGQPRQALQYLDRAAALQAATDDLVGLARTRIFLGGAHHLLGHLDEAGRHNSAALILAQRLGRRGVHIGALTLMAEVTMDLGDPARAVDLSHQALNLARQAADRFEQASVHNTLGSALARQGMYSDAIEEFTTALALARRINAAHPAAAALVRRAHANAAHGHLDAALDDADEGLRAARESGLTLLEGQAHHAMAIAHLRRDQPDRAIAPLLDATRIHRAFGHRLYLARVMRTAQLLPKLPG